MTAVYRLVRQLAPVGDEDLAGLRHSAEALALRERIVASPPTLPAPATPPRRRRPRVALAGAAAAAAVAVVASSGLVDPPPAAAGVAISREPGWFVARVTDMAADPRAMEAAFREHGLRVKLRLVPASPGVVGEVVAMSDDGRSGIEPLCEGTPVCQTVGVRVPLAYRGPAEITLGRPARPGERYTSTAISAFAPGEVLHCSGLYNATVADFLAAARARGLRVDWHVVRSGRGSVEPRPPAGSDRHHVTDVAPLAEGRVLATARPAPGDAAHAPRCP